MPKLLDELAELLVIQLRVAVRRNQIVIFAALLQARLLPVADPVAHLAWFSDRLLRWLRSFPLLFLQLVRLRLTVILGVIVGGLLIGFELRRCHWLLSLRGIRISRGFTVASLFL